jgi:hypothetical protein
MGADSAALLVADGNTSSKLREQKDFTSEDVRPVTCLLEVTFGDDLIGSERPVIGR